MHKMHFKEEETRFWWVIGVLYEYVSDRPLLGGSRLVGGVGNCQYLAIFNFPTLDMP